MIVNALRAETYANNPLRAFLFSTDNKELINYLQFWKDVEKLRWEENETSFENFVSSVSFVTFTRSINACAKRDKS